MPREAATVNHSRVMNSSMFKRMRAVAAQAADSCGGMPGTAYSPVMVWASSSWLLIMSAGVVQQPVERGEFWSAGQSAKAPAEGAREPVAIGLRWFLQHALAHGAGRLTEGFSIQRGQGLQGVLLTVRLTLVMLASGQSKVVRSGCGAVRLKKV